ncbi:hypothetical protein EDC15_102274 [Acetobacter aceti NBRC 14818]|nr:hypothetical protein EDC15_102274 [Acetobacter aceti NBRC 14818]
MKRSIQTFNHIQKPQKNITPTGPNKNSLKNRQTKLPGFIILKYQTQENSSAFFVFIQVSLNFWSTQQGIDFHCIVESRIRLEVDFRSNTQAECVR